MVSPLDAVVSMTEGLGVGEFWTGVEGVVGVDAGVVVGVVEGVVAGVEAAVVGVVVGVVVGSVLGGADVGVEVGVVVGVVVGGTDAPTEPPLSGGVLWRTSKRALAWRKRRNKRDEKKKDLVAFIMKESGDEKKCDGRAHRRWPSLWLVT